MERKARRREAGWMLGMHFAERWWRQQRDLPSGAVLAGLHWMYVAASQAALDLTGFWVWECSESSTCSSSPSSGFISHQIYFNISLNV